MSFGNNYYDSLLYNVIRIGINKTQNPIVIRMFYRLFPDSHKFEDFVRYTDKNLKSKACRFVHVFPYVKFLFSDLSNPGNLLYIKNCEVEDGYLISIEHFGACFTYISTSVNDKRAEQYDPQFPSPNINRPSNDSWTLKYSYEDNGRLCDIEKRFLKLPDLSLDDILTVIPIEYHLDMEAMQEIYFSLMKAGRLNFTNFIDRLGCKTEELTSGLISESLNLM